MIPKLTDAYPGAKEPVRFWRRDEVGYPELCELYWDGDLIKARVVLSIVR